VREKVLVEEHPQRLESQHVLAGAYQADGQVEKVVALMEHVIAVKARVFRDDYPSRLVSIEVLEDMYAHLTSLPTRRKSLRSGSSRRYFNFLHYLKPSRK
jgi:hypothetical protein